MENDYVKCSKGHFYRKSEHAECPYCPKITGTKNTEGVKTVGVTIPGTVPDPTINNPSGNMEGPNNPPRTRIMDPSAGSDAGFNNDRAPFNMVDNRAATRFEDGSRDYRRLVGWLVSYTLSDKGVSFSLFEGRNIIGRDMNCNITVADATVSKQHAILLFRDGKYSISDMQSTSGTFVNDEDIELTPRYINDGDIIKMGNTVFKFRSSF